MNNAAHIAQLIATARAGRNLKASSTEQVVTILLRAFEATQGRMTAERLEAFTDATVKVAAHHDDYFLPEFCMDAYCRVFGLRGARANRTTWFKAVEAAREEIGLDRKSLMNGRVQVTAKGLKARW